jgi:hypothetical protein
MGAIDLDLLSIDDGSVQFLDGSLSGIVVSHCHEGVTLLGDVDIGNFTASGKFVFQSVPGAPGIDSVDK